MTARRNEHEQLHIVDRFKLNGCTESFTEPYHFLDQAHGILACVDEALHENDRGPLNTELLQSAVRGASMLVWLASAGLAAMDENRSDGRAA